MVRRALELPDADLVGIAIAINVAELSNRAELVSDTTPRSRSPVG